MASHLCNTKRSPLLLPQQLQRALLWIMVILWNCLEHVLGKLDMSVLILAVVVPIREISIVSQLGCERFRTYLAE